MNDYVPYVRGMRPVLDASLSTYVEDELEKLQNALIPALLGGKGTATLASGTASVTLYPEEPDDAYEVFLSSGVNETLYVTGKTKGGFTVNSSNGASTASVSWLLVR